jgi:queuosine biosynthesis protein QueD
MWMCDPRILCRKHLLGEHTECHMFLGSLNKKISIDGYITNDLFEPLLLKTRHDALADEISKRGYNHTSPLIFNQDLIFSYLPKHYINHKINKRNSLFLLLSRCQTCYNNFLNLTEKHMYSVTKSFKFEAAHRLLSVDESHGCRNIHGHSYVVRVTISVPGIKELENPHMVVDFGKMKEFKNQVIDNLDHKLILNSKDELINILKDVKDVQIIQMPQNLDPTAENMAHLFSINLRDICIKHFGILSATIKIDVDETVGNTASYTLQFATL